MVVKNTKVQFRDFCSNIECSARYAVRLIYNHVTIKSDHVSDIPYLFGVYLISLSFLFVFVFISLWKVKF